jgi:hypothetical protein
MKELLELYENRYKPVLFLLNKTNDKNRRIELNERLREITRAIYEIKKQLNKI